MTAGEGDQGGGRGADGRRQARESVPEFIERFAALLITAGFPPMPARVFVALIVTDSGRLSSVELTELLREGVDVVGGPGTAAGQRMTEQAEFFDFLSDELRSMLARWPDSTES